MGPQSRRDILRIIPFGLFWMIFSLIYLLLEKGLLADLNYYPSTGNPYEFGSITVYYILITTMSGLLIGTFEIKFLNARFTKMSLGAKIVLKTTLYVATMIVFLSIIRMFGYTLNLETNVFDPLVWSSMQSFITSTTFWAVELYIAVIIGASLFFSEVSENVGIKALHHFLTGKYHHPIEEKRIFMFLDMNSSTTIAEEIGHIQYFEMLREYYSDLSNSIIQYSGQIYQYVGDEVIVSWKVKSSVESTNCLKCFFSMKKSLENQSEKYESRYGVVPSFKAGIHLGYVTTGEIGVIKKDIVFTGDVLNVTARIQSLCKTYEVDLLLSNEFKNEIKFNNEYQFKSLGQNELKGRNETMELFTVHSNDS